jgi:putative ABC transport system permease protein
VRSSSTTCSRSTARGQPGPWPCEGAQPPANVAVMPVTTFARTLAPSLRRVTPGNVGSSAVPGALDGVQWQVQAQVDPASLTGSPRHAMSLAVRARNRAERSLPGQVQFVDNLADSLKTASEDALYAEALYIMLAVPGALVALGLAYLAALGTVERDRRDLALLRARGASRRDLVVLGLAESVLVGLVAGFLGAADSFAAVSLLVSGGVPLTIGRGLPVGATGAALAIVGAAAARLGATATVLRTSVVEARRSVRRDRPPLWQRLYLDLFAVALSGLIYWLTARTGFAAVVNPDSNPTLSLSIYMFFGPALLWVGATLLLVRLRGRTLAWAATRATGGRPRGLRDFLLASAGRRGAAINRG